ncbi:hypothetical protein JXI42_13635 [bacterium]|nr:hypothetical protein [bacterium]
MVCKVLKKQRFIILCVAAVSLMLLFGIIEAKKDNARSKEFSGEQWFEVNNCQVPLTNYGEFGYMYGFWPKGSGEAYIFGSGVWIGGIRSGQRLVSCGYNTYGAGNDFMPGPPEHNDDHHSNPNSHPEDRVLFSNNDDDLELWPESRRDSLGEPMVLGDLDAYCEYNDLLPDQHTWDPGTRPLNVHVKQLTFGWTTKLYVNMFFLLYEIENVGDERINDMYVGMGSDMDVGFADDDLTGCDVARSLGYTYTLSQESDWSSRPPYYVGVKFLQGPKADDTVFVAAPPGTDNPDYPEAIMDTVLPGERLVLTSFTRCTREKGGDPANDDERYEMLAGFNIETHDYDPWQGVADEVPADKRQVMGCGPFDLEPGEIDTFLVGIMFSNGGTGGLEYLQSEGDAALTAYNAGWVVPSPPAAPNLVGIPGDQKVSLIWDNTAEFEPDPFQDVMAETGDTLYRRYDFEGYRLWKSRTGLPEEWDLLGEWDIENDITLLPDDMWIVNDDYPDGFSVSGNKSNNEGLEYSYIDEDVMNGVSYFYALTAFDYNAPGAIPNESGVYVSLESGIDEILVTPRAETGDFNYPTASNLEKVSGSTNSLVDFNAEIIGDIGVIGHDYEVQWMLIEQGTGGTPIYTYNIFDITDDEYISPVVFEVPTTEKVRGKTVSSDPDTLPDEMVIENSDSIVKIITVVWDEINIDSTWMWAGFFQKPFDGLLVSGSTHVMLNYREIERVDTIKYTLKIKPDDYNVWRDSTIVRTQTFSHTLLDTSVNCFTLPDSIYILEDVGTAYGGALTPFTTFQSRWAYHGGADLKIEWLWYHGSHDSITMRVTDLETGEEIPYANSFGDNWTFGFGSTPSNEYLTGTQPPPHRIWFYVAGLKYNFSGGGPMNWAQHPESGDVWIISSSASTIPPVVGNVYSFQTEDFSYKSKSDMDMIKVVPNPYVIRADWDRSKNTRRIQFTHLPRECTIRIYTLSGELVRTLEHSSTAEGGGVEEWDLRTEDDQIPASGVYIYHISTPKGQEKIGKFGLIR